MGKDEGGLSQQIPVQGVPQGCSLAFEPLLRRLRSRLSGSAQPGTQHNLTLIVSNYADEINVFVRAKVVGGVFGRV